jgi:hypothetical protein
MTLTPTQAFQTEAVTLQSIRDALRRILSFLFLLGSLFVFERGLGQSPVGLTNGLIAFYALDGSGSDLSGFGNHGTVVGLKSGTNRFHRPGQAMLFDGSGYIDIKNQRLLDGASQATIMGWVLLHPSSHGGFIVGAGDSRPGMDPFSVAVAPWLGRWAQREFNDPTLGSSHPQRFVGIGDWMAPTNVLSVSLGRWLHFAQVFRSQDGTSEYSFYVDGQVMESRSFPYSFKIRYDQSMPVQIGALTSFSNSRFYGLIDDVRFYNRALSSEEIFSVYSFEITPPPPTLSVEVARVRVKLGLTPGFRYLLEVSSDLKEWTPTGAAFRATSLDEEQEFQVGAEPRFFRVTRTP